MTFQPGQSGNPAGRPKGVRAMAAILWKSPEGDED